MPELLGAHQVCMIQEQGASGADDRVNHVARARAVIAVEGPSLARPCGRDSVQPKLGYAGAKALPCKTGLCLLSGAEARALAQRGFLQRVGVVARQRRFDPVRLVSTCIGPTTDSSGLL